MSIHQTHNFPHNWKCHKNIPALIDWRSSGTPDFLFPSRLAGSTWLSVRPKQESINDTLLSDFGKHWTSTQSISQCPVRRWENRGAATDGIVLSGPLDLWRRPSSWRQSIFMLDWAPWLTEHLTGTQKPRRAMCSVATDAKTGVQTVLRGK